MAEWFVLRGRSSLGSLDVDGVHRLRLSDVDGDFRWPILHPSSPRLCEREEMDVRVEAEEVEEFEKKDLLLLTKSLALPDNDPLDLLDTLLFCFRTGLRIKFDSCESSVVACRFAMKPIPSIVLFGNGADSWV